MLFLLTSGTWGYILCTEGIDQVRIAAEPGKRFKK